MGIFYVCWQEAGFTFVELNASDTRSKKSLQQEVDALLGNHTLMDYMGMIFVLFVRFCWGRVK